MIPRYPYLSTSGDIIVGDDMLDTMLNPVATAGEDILVGAPMVDADLAALAGLTSTSGSMAIGADAFGGADLLVGAPLGYESVDPGVLVGAPISQARRAAAQAALVQQNRALQAQLAATRQQMQRTAQPPPRQLGTVAKVVDQQPEKYRKIPLPVNSETDIPAGQTRNVVARPQVRAKPLRLIIENPERWRILDIKVGNKSQLIAAGALPGVLFSNDSTDVTLVGDTAGISQDVIVVVENKTGADHRFEGAFVCHSVD